MSYLSAAESHRRINGYLDRLDAAISLQDGASLAALLAISGAADGALSPLADALAASSLHDAADAAQSELSAALLRSIHAVRLRRFVDAYTAYERAALAFLQEFRNWETAWAMKAVNVIAIEIRLVAEKADKELIEAARSAEKLQKAGSFLMRVFGALAVKGPKRVGALYVACQLFKIYFKLGTVHLCRSVIRSVETARIFDFDEFPPEDKVMYMYYTGRLEVFNENFSLAEQKFTYALTHCHPQDESNLRKVLKFLIPVKLSMGVLPTTMLLEKYNLLEYADIVNALKRGDLRLLRWALEEYETQFLRSGVYLMIEKLELQVYQRLVKKIYCIQRERDPARVHQIKMETIVKALKWLQIDTDVDEVECIVACLIHKNLIRGYFAHKSKILVLSKQDPFPKMNARPVSS